MIGLININYNYMCIHKDLYINIDYCNNNHGYIIGFNDQKT